MRTYIPSKIKFGRIDNLPEWANANAYAEASILSCQDVRRRWVNVGNFKDLVGYEPSVSRDSRTEMMKSVTGAIDELANVPLDGFVLEGGAHDGVDLSATRLVGVHPKHGGCAFVRDPRGPLVVVNAGDLASEIVDGRLTVGKDGRISGTFVWGLGISNGSHGAAHFRLVETSGTAFREAEKEREVAEARKMVSYVPADMMTAGTVYNQSSSKDPLCSKFLRVVYLGQIRCIPTTVAKVILAHDRYLNPFGSYWPKPQELILKKLAGENAPGGSGGACLPWEMEDWRSACGEFRKWCATDGLQHVFAVLRPVPGDVRGDRQLRVSSEKTANLDLIVNVLACPAWNEKNIRGVSEDQTITFTRKRFWGYGERTEQYSADELIAGVKASTKALELKMKHAIALFPPEEPASLPDYVAKLRRLSR